MQVDLDRVKFLVREATRIAPGRPAVKIGLRAALAVAAPMAIASMLGPIVMTWATLGGFGVVLVDKGGAYRTRAIAMTAAAVGGALGVLIGTLAAGTHGLLAVVSIGAGLCAMAATWTGPAVAVGNTIAVQLVVAATLPGDPGHCWIPSLGFLLGAAWTLCLTLFLWPVRVYRPARLAAMQCLREVARHAGAIAARSELPDGEDAVAWREAITRRHRAMRETLETARAVLAATRRGRRGEIGRGERLLVTVEMADQLFGVLIGVEDVVDLMSRDAHAAIDGELRAGLRAAAERLDDVADRLIVEDDLPALAALDWRPDAGRARLAALPALARAEGEHALSLVYRIHEDIANVLAVVDTLGDERDPGLPPAIVAPSAGGEPVQVAADALSWDEALKSSLDFESVVLRHALRVATVALAAVVVIRVLGLQRGYWTALTAILLLQPYLPATITRGLQRVGGTIAGGVLATLIAAVIHDPLGIAVIAIVGAGISASMLQLNYGLYALFLTPTFVLLAEVHAHDSHLVELRITNTLIGAGLAVVGALVLWPVREQTQTADRLAGALDAAAGYLRAIFHVVTSHAPPRTPEVIAARRAAGRAFNHADLSLDRLVAEGPPSNVLEPRMAVVTMTRRLAASLSAFASARHVTEVGGGAGAILETIGNDAERYLHAAATALRERSAPPVYARHDALAEQLPALLAARVTRIDLQLSIIAEAVARTLRA